MAKSRTAETTETPYVETKYVAKRLLCSVSALDRLAKKPDGLKPAGYLLEKKVYRLSDVEEWERRQLARSFDQLGRARNLPTANLNTEGDDRGAP